MPGRPARLAVAALGLVALAALLFSPAPAPAAVAQDGGPRTWQRQAVWAPGYDTGGLLRPQGLAAAPGNRFYVADYGHDRVAVVDADGAVTLAFGRRGDGPGELLGPTDVAVDAGRDRVYVVDRGNKRLALFTLAGVPLGQWMRAGPEHAFVPWAVAVSPLTGDVYAISTQIWARVERFDSEGRWLGGWGDVGAGPGQFRNPQDLAVAPDGRVLVADTGNSRVQVFSLTGAPMSELRPLPAVRAVAVSETGDRIYALHSLLLDPPGYLAVFDGALAGQGTLGSSDLPGGFVPGTGVAVGGDGRVAVTIDVGAADRNQGLRAWDPGSRRLVAAAVANPLDYAGFLRPEALAVAPSGDVYLAEGLLQVTRRYAPDGAFRGLVNRGLGQELAFGPGGELVLLNGGAFGGAAGIRRFNAAGTEQWTKSCDCLSGLGLAATADRIFATDGLSRTLGAFDLTSTNERRVATYPLGGLPYGGPVDLARGPDGLLYVAGGDGGPVLVLDPADGAERARWPVGGGGAERITVAPDGTVLVLRFDGSLAAFSAAGVLERAWTPDPAPGAALLRPKDIAAGPGARLYVLDGETAAVLVYDAVSGVAPTPPPTPEPPCVVTGDKTASPGRVTLGETVDVALTLDIQCRAGAETRADVMLVIDRSGSMAGADPPTKLDKAKEAADGFVSRLDLDRHRVGLVSFESASALDQPLTADLAAIRAAIAGVQPSGSTDIAGATERALRQLRLHGRAGALPVILLLTDGEPSGPRQAWVDSVRVAARARAQGALVYTIGLGENVKAELLIAMAGAPDRYFYAPTGEALDPIYRQLSQVIGEVVATDVVVTDEMGPDVDYVAGSAQAEVSPDSRRLVWTIGALPAGGARLSLAVRPRRAGRLPTNTRAEAQYTAGGARYSFAFPVPEVEVVEPPTVTPTPTDTPTASPSPTPSATPTATRRPPPKRVYLPLALRGACQPDEAKLGADIVLALDTSTSMTGAKLEAAVRAAKLFLTEVDPRRDRVGLVTFSAVATRSHWISADLGSVARHLDSLSVSEGTNLEGGLRESRAELALRARPGSQRVVILLSDGQPTVGSAASALAEAAALKRDGATLFAIGLGADVDATLLRQLASSAAHYYFAPGPEQLTDIYRRVAGNLPCR